MLTYQDCQNHVLRPRVSVKVTDISGSRGCVPGELCHLLSSCCSNPRRDWLCQTVRLCECMPWAGAGVKSTGQTTRSEIPAKIAAFCKGEGSSKIGRHSGESRNLPQFCGQTPAFAGVTVREKAFHLSKALSHCANTNYQHYRSNGLEAGAGTSPSLHLEAPGVAPLRGEAGLFHFVMPP